MKLRRLVFAIYFKFRHAKNMSVKPQITLTTALTEY